MEQRSAGEAAEPASLPRSRSTSELEEAVELFTRALRSARAPWEEASLSLRRSQTFASLAARLRAIPAQQSEEHPLFALDPTHLANLALRDAERCCALRAAGAGCARAHLARGQAHALLEQYGEAQAAFLAGLGCEPSHAPLARALAEVEAVLAEGRAEAAALRGGAQPQQPAPARPAADEAAEAEAECTLCLKLLYQPVTTPCGHSFCRPCLAQALDHRNKCPLCRTVLLMSAAQLQPSVTLAALLQRFFPAQQEARAREEAALAARLSPAGAAAAAPLLATLPLFVMDVVLPQQRLSLNIFEPRYRLMVRRCMGGARRFCMVGVDRDRQLLAWATEVEILECEALPDGRFHLDVVGRRRARLLSSEEQDGYRLARCELEGAAEAADEEAGAEAEEAPRPSLAQLAGCVDSLLAVWTQRLRGAAGEEAFAAHLEHCVGPKPTAEQPAQLAWWVAALLPVSPSERYALLAAGSTRQLLQREMAIMGSPSASTGACAVQ